MRFRKSVKICKGVKVNFSKSGPSLTVGTRGASVNVGKKGAYLNTSIPGTGLYDRKKIGSSNSKANKTKTSTVQETFNLEYNDDGTVAIYNSSGQTILDEGLIRKIKKTPQYKQELERMSQVRISKFDEEINSFIKIKDKATKVRPTTYYQNALHALKPEVYVKESFKEDLPSEDEVIQDLTKKGKHDISTLKFWKKKELVNQYINENKGRILEERILDWQQRKDSFETTQNEKEAIENRKSLLDFQAQQQHLKLLLENNINDVSNAIDTWIATITFPFNFEMQYNISDCKAYIDLDLPEIEDIPLKFAKQMANGTVKIKDKAAKTIKQEYYDCALGLALFFTSHVFNCAIGIEQIIISAYTQRKNTKALVNDEYIYSIIFDRNSFAKIQSFDDVSICFEYEHKCEVKTDKSFKEIIPFHEL